MKAQQLGEATAAALIQQTDQMAQYERYARQALHNKEAREALHYAN